MNAITTLNEIRTHGPCYSGWATLLRGLGKTKPDDAPLPLARILEINGVADAVWAIRAVSGNERPAHLFACGCAESVLPIFEKRHPGDKRPRKAIEVARRFADGEATEEELRAARNAASDAAYASYASYDASASSSAHAAAAAADSYAANSAYYASYLVACGSASDARIELFKKHFCSE